MVKKVFKELVVYLLVVIVLAISFHGDLLSDPMSRLSRLPDAAIIFGSMHPFIFGIFGYLLLSLIRSIFNFIKNLFSKGD